MSEIALQSLSLDDLPQIQLLEAYTGIHAWPRHSYEMAFRAGWPIVGLHQSGQLIAVLAYQVAGNQCSLLNVVVSQSHLGNGHGRYLVEYLVQLAETAECDTVFLEVREDNEPAVSLYESLGFSVINTRAGYYEYKGKSVTGLDMALALGMDAMFGDAL